MQNSISYRFSKDALASIKSKVLFWLKSYSTFAYLDNNEFEHQPNRYELLVGADVATFITIDEISATTHQWRFGYIAYDYKNRVEPTLTSDNQDLQSAPDQDFFIPKIVVYIPFGQTELIVESNQDCQIILTAILAINVPVEIQMPHIHWQPLMSYQQYHTAVNTILQHIVEGDCYEMNFCSGQHATTVVEICPVSVFYKLNKINKAPFAACIQIKDIAVMAASPERFLHKQADTLTAQPIKGTIKRDKTTAYLDALQKASLAGNSKEQAENVMIVDLMRNDMAKISEIGSVNVPELFGIYTFEFVHHMISTISSQLKQNTGFKEIIHASFPMGSMTGTPKYIVMQLIEAYEEAKRGVFAGAIGYISPDEDFDLNVVIRSLIYNTRRHTLSYYTGGAITIDSDPQKEYEEMLLKASGLAQIFNP